MQENMKLSEALERCVVPFHFNATSYNKCLLGQAFRETGVVAQHNVVHATDICEYWPWLNDKFQIPELLKIEFSRLSENSGEQIMSAFGFAVVDRRAMKQDVLDWLRSIGK